MHISLKREGLNNVKFGRKYRIASSDAIDD